MLGTGAERFEWSLRRKFLAIVLVLAAFAIAEGAYHIYRTFTQKRTDAEAKVVERAREMALEIERFVGATGHVLQALSEVPAIKQMDRRESEAILSRLLPQYPQFENLFAVGKDGWIRATVVHPEGGRPVDVRDRPYFREVMATGRLALGGVQTGRLTGKPVLVVAYPVRDFSGRLTGIVGAPISLTRFHQWLAEHESEAGAGTTITLVHKEGRVIADSSAREARVAADVRESPWFRQVAAMKEWTLELAMEDGVPRLAGLAPALAGAVYVVASSPRDVVFAPLRQEIYERALFLLAAFLGMVLAAEMAVRHFTKPLARLADGARRIGAGALDERIPVSGRDEVAVAAAAFNQMAASLQKREEDIERSAAELNEAYGLLLARTRETGLMLDVAQALSSTMDIDDRLAVFVEKMAKGIPVTFCRVALLDGKGDHLVIRAAYPLRALDWDPGVGQVFPLTDCSLAKQAFADQKPIVLENIQPADFRPGCVEAALVGPARSALLLPLEVKGRKLGVVTLGEMRSWDRESFHQGKVLLCAALVDQVGVAVENARLYEDLDRTLIQTVSCLARAIDAKSPWTRGHSERVMGYAIALGERLGLADEELESLRLAGLLHDIGKIGTYDYLLEKPDHLTEEEIRTVREHPLKSAEILEPIAMFRKIVPAVRSHHERWDGKGYPDGLAGEGIPLSGRILAVADTYDAIMADRPYRKSPGREWALAEIRRCGGTQFDPAVVEAFLQIPEEIMEQAAFDCVNEPGVFSGRP